MSRTSTWLLNPSRDGDSTLPWAAVPVPDHPFSEEIFSNIQLEPLPVELVAISSCPGSFPTDTIYEGKLL